DVGRVAKSAVQIEIQPAEHALIRYGHDTHFADSALHCLLSPQKRNFVSTSLSGAMVEEAIVASFLNDIEPQNNRLRAVFLSECGYQARVIEGCGGQANLVRSNLHTFGRAFFTVDASENRQRHEALVGDLSQSCVVRFAVHA